MLPKNIDLTSEGDFGEQPGLLHASAFSRVYSQRLAEIGNSIYMSLEDYKSITLHDKFFGRRYHSNQKDEVFDKEGEYLESWRSKCLCCGCPIKSPWNNIGGCCKQCYSFADHTVPWKENTIEFSFNENTVRNLFDSR